MYEDEGEAKRKRGREGEREREGVGVKKGACMTCTSACVVHLFTVQRQFVK